MKDLATAVLNVAVTRAQGATRRSYRRARHPADNRADRTSNHGSGDDARCGASCLLRRLAGRDRKTLVMARSTHSEDIYRCHDHALRLSRREFSPSP
jgi:hypothetical protein